jgi:hypothetical protein
MLPEAADPARQQDLHLAVARPAEHDPRGPTYGERHRHACEVRYVAAMDSERREAFLKQVRERRGDAASKALLADVVRLLNARAARGGAARRSNECLPGLFPEPEPA